MTSKASTFWLWFRVNASVNLFFCHQNWAGIFTRSGLPGRWLEMFYLMGNLNTGKQ